jgi:hypothetical protein
MAATAISIDAGASGLLRHRFIRAIAASTFVLIAIGFIVLTVQGLHFAWEQPDSEKYGPIGAIIASSLSIALIALLMFFFFSLVVALVATVFGIVHRRLAALLLLLVNLITVAVGVIAPIGFLAPGTPSSQEYTPLQIGAMVVLVIVAGLIAIEGTGWAWWQLRVPRAQFFAARGWRPSAWRIYSTMRQSIGLPGFISNFGRGRLVLTLTYFLVAVLNIGLVAAFAIPFTLFSIERGADFSQQLIFIAGMAGLLILNFIGVGKLLQGFASWQATRLYQKARDWDSRPPVVFLRAFDQDAEKLKAQSKDPLVKFPAGCGEAHTLDELLLENASVYGPVIAIGDPRDPTPPLGAARIFVPGGGNEWQHVVTSLLGASSAVVMCPSTSEGVKWELDLISDAIGRLKVIYLANPLLTTEQTHALFQRLAPAGEFPALKKKQVPVAAFLDAHRNWIVLTTSKPPCVQTYTVALNYALQSLLGMQGTPLPKQRRGSAKSPNPRAQAA